MRLCPSVWLLRPKAVIFVCSHVLPGQPASREVPGQAADPLQREDGGKGGCNPSPGSGSHVGLQETLLQPRLDAGGGWGAAVLLPWRLCGATGSE